MSSTRPEAFYQKHIEEIQKEYEQRQAKYQQLSRLRLISVLAAITFFFTDFWGHNLVANLLGIIFIFLVQKARKIKQANKLVEMLLEINENELKALNYDFSVFENGEEFLDATHPFSYDLDIFGEKSIFQLLNRTSTLGGKKRLAAYLSELTTDVEQIKQRQEAVAELSEKPKWRQYFQAVGNTSFETEKTKEQLLKWLNMPQYFSNKKHLKLLGILLPASTIITGILYAFELIPLFVFFGNDRNPIISYRITPQIYQRTSSFVE